MGALPEPDQGDGWPTPAGRFERSVPPRYGREWVWLVAGLTALGALVFLLVLWVS
jgi:hypothetical protein